PVHPFAFVIHAPLTSMLNTLSLHDALPILFADEFKKFKCHQLIRNSLRSSCQELKSLGIGLNCTGYVPNARKNLYNKFIFIGPVFVYYILWKRRMRNGSKDTAISNPICTCIIGTCVGCHQCSG